MTNGASGPGLVVPSTWARGGMTVSPMVAAPTIAQVMASGLAETVPESASWASATATPGG